MRKIVVVISALTLFFAWSLSAVAQKETTQPDAPEKTSTATSDKAPAVKVERGKGGKKVYRITTGFVIEGRIQKPNAFYVLQRSQINYDWSELKHDFVPRILESVRKSPF
ncbi:MAG: hypothetical protein V1754_01000 [Pseudomonadota bacterium]